MKHLITATTLGLALACGSALADGQKAAVQAGQAATLNQNAPHTMAAGSTDIHSSAGLNKSEGANDLHKAEGADNHPKAGTTASTAIQH